MMMEMKRFTWNTKDDERFRNGEHYLQYDAYSDVG